MFSTICLLFFIGFIFWMNTSRRISWPEKNPVMNYMARKPLYSKFLASALFLLATVLLTGLLGTGSGIFAAFVILMMAGSVCVLFFPFRYFGTRTIGLVYVFGVVSEIIFK